MSTKLGSRRIQLAVILIDGGRRSKKFDIPQLVRFNYVAQGDCVFGSAVSSAVPGLNL